MNAQNQKLLFIYLKTGGGHLAPAKSISKFLENRYSENIEIELYDGLGKSWGLARFVIEDGYRILQNKAKWIYEFIYAVHKFKIVSRLSAFLVSLNTKKYLEKKILDYKPDKIVIFHFFLINPVFEIIKKHKLDIKTFTIVTDPYIAHPLWFLRKDQNFIVFSERLKNSCVKIGINEQTINVFPFVLDEKFSAFPSNEEIQNIKNKFGFTGEKVLLIMGGGDGMPRGIPILKKLLKTQGNFDIAFVCGKNKKMFDKAVMCKTSKEIDRLKVYGYIDFVYELLCISDVVITKCGASTFMEILLSGKVPVVNSYIWEQEKGNVEFIVNNELGIYEKDVNKLPYVINKLLNDRDFLNRYKSNISSADLKNGTAHVAEFIVS